MPVANKSPQPLKAPYNVGLLNWLSKVNSYLEEDPLVIAKFLNRISSSAEEVPQTAVDIICEWSACRVNRKIERIRQWIIRSLHGQNKFVNAILTPIKSLYNAYKNPIDGLGAVISVVKSILKIIWGPIFILGEFIYDLGKEVLRLAKNLALIASSLPPRPINPRVNFNKFRLSIGSLGMNTITEDPSNLPDPDKLFPQTAPTPFISKEFWAKVGEGPRQATRRTKTYITGTWESRNGVAVAQEGTIA